MLKVYARVVLFGPPNRTGWKALALTVQLERLSVHLRSRIGRFQLFYDGSHVAGRGAGTDCRARRRVLRSSMKWRARPAKSASGTRRCSLPRMVAVQLTCACRFGKQQQQQRRDKQQRRDLTIVLPRPTMQFTHRPITASDWQWVCGNSNRRRVFFPFAWSQYEPC